MLQLTKGTRLAIHLDSLPGFRKAKFVYKEVVDFAVEVHLKGLRYGKR